MTFLANHTRLSGVMMVVVMVVMVVVVVVVKRYTKTLVSLIVTVPS